MNGRQAGAVTVELVLLTPVVLALLLFTVGLGRIENTDGLVTGAARDAARAASQAQNPREAVTVARSAAAGDLADGPCRAATVAVDTTGFAAGGVVRVHVACTAALSDLALSGLPGHKTLTATAAAPIETYRSVTP